MGRAIWKGEISFGLLNIQVELHSAIRSNKVSFKLVDERDGARVRYQRINEETGEEVSWDQIAKAYEFDDGEMLQISDEDLDEFKPELSKTIDLEQFVPLPDISVLLYDRPYYLVPSSRSGKPYVLLRETLKQQNKCGIGKVVIRTKQHLAALFPVEDALVLNLLMFPEEVKPLAQFEFPEASAFEDKIKSQEIKLSNQLVESMSGTWNPENYRDTYSEELLNWLEERRYSTETRKAPRKPKEKAASNVVDIQSLLEKSLKEKKPTKKKPAKKRKPS